MTNASSADGELDVVADGIAKVILDAAPIGSQMCAQPAGQIGPVTAIGEEGVS